MGQLLSDVIDVFDGSFVALLLALSVVGVGRMIYDDEVAVREVTKRLPYSFFCILVDMRFEAANKHEELLDFVEVLDGQNTLCSFVDGESFKDSIMEVVKVHVDPADV